MPIRDLCNFQKAIVTRRNKKEFVRKSGIVNEYHAFCHMIWVNPCPHASGFRQACACSTERRKSKGEEGRGKVWDEEEMIAK